MIGFYDYTVILTYLGALAGLLGITMSVNGCFKSAVVCMCAALLCDTLDGMVARRKKNRTKDEMLFGIQIDSLCDLISFGVCPSVMFYMLGMDSWTDLALLGAYCLCCVIRLGYFNTLAVQAELGTKGDYHGLPVVCLDSSVPMLYVIFLRLPLGLGLWLLRGAAAVFGFLYILDFRVKKPDWKVLIVMGVVAVVPLAILLFVL